MDRPALEKLARLIRYYILTMTTAAGSGHATSSLSAVELATTLFFKYLRYDLDNPQNPTNDRVIFSKGHASPLYYALYAAAGKITEEELLKYRTFGSVLEGHPTNRFPYTEAPTGSLGQGLSIGAGEALALRAAMTNHSFQPEKIVDSTLPMVYVLLGDGELAEGSVWEAAAFASFYKLNNLVAIVDVNRLGQSQETMYEHHAEIYQRRFDTFGWSTIVLDGHNWDEVDLVIQKAMDHKKGPVAIIAKTIKGKGVSFLEDKNGWHGKALSKDELEKALAELGEVDKTIVGVVQKPKDLNHESGIKNTDTKDQIQDSKFTIQYSSPTATRKAFGNALVKLGEVDPTMVVLDGDVQNSTYTELFAKKYPQRFVQCYIAEQNMVGMALGLAKRGYAPWIATFSAFLTRAHDQLRMAALAGADIKICGSHAGVSIGEDGPSQMGLEDIALFRALSGSTVFYPSDAVSTERISQVAQKQNGMVYIRTTRPETPILYTDKDEFVIGGSKTFEPSAQASVTVVAAGITLHEALKAQKELEKEQIGVRVIDCYSIKPIDVANLQKAATETKAMIVVEDHYPEGGLGEAVTSALSDSPSVPIIHLAVRKAPQSGTAAELLAYEGIDSAAIVSEVKKFLKK